MKKKQYEIIVTDNAYTEKKKYNADEQLMNALLDGVPAILVSAGN